MPITKPTPVSVRNVAGVMRSVVRSTLALAAGSEQDGEDHQQRRAQAHRDRLGRPRRRDQQQAAHAQRGQHEGCRDAGGEEVGEAERIHDAIRADSAQATIAGMPRMSWVVYRMSICSSQGMPDDEGAAHQDRAWARRPASVPGSG